MPRSALCLASGVLLSHFPDGMRGHSPQSRFTQFGFVSNNLAIWLSVWL